MSEHTHAEKLAYKPPRVKLSHRKFVQRLAGQALALVGIVLAVVGIGRAVAVGRCLNSDLGQRSAPSAADAAAHVAWARSLATVLAAPRSAAPADYLAFVGATQMYVRTLEADQAARNAHPLGKC